MSSQPSMAKIYERILTINMDFNGLTRRPHILQPMRSMGRKMTVDHPIYNLLHLLLKNLFSTPTQALLNTQVAQTNQTDPPTSSSAQVNHLVILLSSHLIIQIMGSQSTSMSTGSIRIALPRKILWLLLLKMEALE